MVFELYKAINHPALWTRLRINRMKKKKKKKKKEAILPSPVTLARKLD
jgi:hypothetical protein